LFLSEKV